MALFQEYTSSSIKQSTVQNHYYNYGNLEHAKNRMSNRGWRIDCWIKSIVTIYFTVGKKLSHDRTLCICYTAAIKDKP